MCAKGLLCGRAPALLPPLAVSCLWARRALQGGTAESRARGQPHTTLCECHPTHDSPPPLNGISGNGSSGSHNSVGWFKGGGEARLATPTGWAAPRAAPPQHGGRRPQQGAVSIAIIFTSDPSFFQPHSGTLGAAPVVPVLITARSNAPVVPEHRQDNLLGRLM